MKYLCMIYHKKSNRVIDQYIIEADTAPLACFSAKDKFEKDHPYSVVNKEDWEAVSCTIDG